MDLERSPSTISAEAECLDRVQAAFEVMACDSLIYRGDQPRRLLLHLGRQVAARPKLLSLHVRRIFLSIQLGDRQELLAALADLCWVLESRGQLLMKRLIQQAGALLSGEQQQLLSRYLECPDPDCLKQLVPQRSVLINGGFSLQL
ncbi:hypothetical protein DV711_17000 [Motiliproteus coralliicola]|uniref:Uncharacterized protein n=1 Tax=Motiliproteus coralliicola TaxID=2283196 RepID=A0A369WAM1_9GAMM|nr:hypothetical protein DV711_17000 [Motiliproteus coralliicola]